MYAQTFRQPLRLCFCLPHPACYFSPRFKPQTFPLPIFFLRRLACWLSPVRKTTQVFCSFPALWQVYLPGQRMRVFRSSYLSFYAPFLSLAFGRHRRIFFLFWQAWHFRSSLLFCSKSLSL